MKPTKEYTGRSTIRMYNADCMDLMNSGQTWDLAIVDPPYGIKESKRQRKNTPCKRWKSATNDIPYKKKKWDSDIPSAKYFNTLKNVSLNQIVWGGGNYMTDYLPPSMGWVFWDKKNGDTDFSDGELAWTSFNKALRKFEWLWSGFQKQKPEKRIHPTQKPVQLYKWLLTNYADSGQTILDTHGGSMSIAIACWNLGFDLDICELDTDYFKNAVKRFEQHISQTQLF